MTVEGQWSKESREFWRLCPHCGLKHCCNPSPGEEALIALPIKERGQRADASSSKARRSTSTAKPKTRVVKQVRKTSKARTPKV